MRGVRTPCHPWKDVGQNPTCDVERPAYLQCRPRGVRPPPLCSGGASLRQAYAPGATHCNIGSATAQSVLVFSWYVDGYRTHADWVLEGIAVRAGVPGQLHDAEARPAAEERFLHKRALAALGRSPHALACRRTRRARIQHCHRAQLRVLQQGGGAGSGSKLHQKSKSS